MAASHAGCAPSLQSEAVWRAFDAAITKVDATRHRSRRRTQTARASLRSALGVPWAHVDDGAQRSRSDRRRSRELYRVALPPAQQGVVAASHAGCAPSLQASRPVCVRFRHASLSARRCGGSLWCLDAWFERSPLRRRAFGARFCLTAPSTVASAVVPMAPTSTRTMVYEDNGLRGQRPTRTTVPSSAPASSAGGVESARVRCRVPDRGGAARESIPSRGRGACRCSRLHPVPK